MHQEGRGKRKPNGPFQCFARLLCWFEDVLQSNSALPNRQNCSENCSSIEISSFPSLLNFHFIFARFSFLFHELKGITRYICTGCCLYQRQGVYFFSHPLALQTFPSCWKVVLFCVRWGCISCRTDYFLHRLYKTVQCSYVSVSSFLLCFYVLVKAGDCSAMYISQSRWLWRPGKQENGRPCFFVCVSPPLSPGSAYTSSESTSFLHYSHSPHMLESSKSYLFLSGR